MVAQLVNNLSAMPETWVQSLCWENPWRREWQPTPVFWSGEFHGLYNPWAHKESDTTEQLSLFTLVKNVPAMQETQIRSLGWENPLGKALATHSSVHTWRTPWTEDPGGLQSMGSQSIRQNRAINTFTFHLMGKL